MFASEYGWTVETIMALPLDQAEELRHAILFRNGNRTIKASVQPGESISLADRAKAIFDTSN